MSHPTGRACPGVLPMCPKPRRVSRCTNCAGEGEGGEVRHGYPAAERDGVAALGTRSDGCDPGYADEVGKLSTQGVPDVGEAFGGRRGAG